MKALKKKDSNREKTMNKKIEWKFIWRKLQQKSFDHMKKSITKNAMSVVIHEIQYHLTINASKKATKTCLFQMHNVFFDSQMKSSLKNKFEIMMFMSFRLNDAKTRYSNTKIKCLAIINSLAKMKWLVLKSKWKIICITNHHVLNSIMTKESKEYKKIATWQNKLKEYNIKIISTFFTNVIIEIIDELSSLLLIFIIKYRTWDEKKSSMTTNEKKSFRATNEENESMTTKRTNEVMNVIMSNDWSVFTRHKELSQNISQTWKRYDANLFFKNMTAYLRYKLFELKKISRHEKKIIIFRFKRYIIVSEKSLLMYEKNDEKKSSCIILK
jgi:hypothetical protein